MGDNKIGAGGAREGAGRPKKEVSEQAHEIMRKAVRMLYSKDNDAEAQVEFIKKFAATPRGMQFVAEHLFGKAPQIIEQEGAMLIQTPLIEFVSANKK